jgi:hypothetical protein
MAATAAYVYTHDGTQPSVRVIVPRKRQPRDTMDRLSHVLGIQLVHR